jgi:hypothetical protein
MSQDRVALYLQDAHDLREGMKLAQYAEKNGFEAVWQAPVSLTTGPAISACWPLHSSPWTIWPQTGSFAVLGPGGIRWPQMSAFSGASR